MISIRKMCSNDFDEVLDMMRVFYASPAVQHKAPDDVLAKDIQDCIGNMPFIEGYVFEEDGEAAGYSMLAKSYSTEYGGICIWIEDVYIKPQFRGLGIGTRFFSFIESEYSDKAVRFRLEVAQDNLKAIEMYKRCGFDRLFYIEMAKEI